MKSHNHQIPILAHFAFTLAHCAAGHPAVTVIGAKAYSLLRNLVSPAKPGGKMFAELCKLMQKHYNPAPSEIVQRCKFNCGFRGEGESVADFVASLRSLAEHCNYGQQLDEMLRDRIVCGIRDDSIQRRLLSEQNLT